MKLAGIIAVAAITAGNIFAADGEWDSTVAVGANLTSGNSETLGVNASVTAEKISEVNELRLGLNGNYGESEINGIDETTTENAKAIAIYKQKFDQLYIYSDNSIFHDDLADIDYRLIIGAGLGRFLIDNDSCKLGIELGAAYIEEKLTDGTKDDNVSARIAARHDHEFSDHAKCWLSVEYIPKVDDSSDYLLNAEAGVEAALNSTLSLRVVVQDRYDSIVPVDREENDLSVISALVYTL